MPVSQVSNNTVSIPSPAQYTPVAQKGTSLQPGLLTFDAGLVSNISVINRPPNSAAFLNCFQMLKPGIWSTDGIGWQPQRAGIFNNGNAFSEFSWLVDNNGVRTPLFQNGINLYSYNLGTSTETQISTPFTLSPGTAPPTFRRFFSLVSGQAGVFYCNGTQQPLKITSTSASSKAQFNMTFPMQVPPAPTIAQVGTAGGTHYTYGIVAVFANSQSTSIGATTVTTTGNATLNGTNYNKISWTAVAEATSYTIYRTASSGTPSTVGIIGTTSSLTFNDTGLAGDGSTAAVQTATTVTINNAWGNSGPYFGNLNVALGVSKTYITPAFCEPFAGRMAFGGFDDTGCRFDVLISDYNNAESFTVSSPPAVTDSIAFSYPPELGQLTAMHVFSVSNLTTQQVLVCGCTNGIFYITGSDSSNFELIIVTREIGIASNRTFVDLNNDCLFLSTQGIRFFSSLSNNNILRTNTASYGINDLINLIDPANWQYAHAVHNLPTCEIQFWVPLIGDSGQCAHAFILNYNNTATAQGTFTPVWSTKDQTAVACSMFWQPTQQMFGGGYGAGTGTITDGLLQLHYNGNTYNGNSYRSTLRTALAYLNNVQLKCGIRAITPIMEGGPQSYTISAYAYTRTGGRGMRRQTANPASWKVVMDQGVTTALNSWQLNISAFPGNNMKTQDYKATGSAIAWDFEIDTLLSTDSADICGVAYTLSGGSYQR
jgi:hypothetical protein